MPTAGTSARRSAPLPKRSKAPLRGARTALGKRIEAAAREVAAHLRGETVPGLREYTLAVPETVDVAGIRAALGLSQAAFARRFGLNVTALQAWEQGRRRPDRTARILLAVIAKEPKAVLRALRTG
jgi:putative transcriptional regulator